jgi:hypothetical protein
MDDCASRNLQRFRLGHAQETHKGVVVAEHLDLNTRLRLRREATSANRQWGRNSNHQEHQHRLPVIGWTIVEFTRTVSRHCSSKEVTMVVVDLNNDLHQGLPLHLGPVVHLPRHQVQHLYHVEDSLRDLVVETGDEETNDSPE